MAPTDRRDTGLVDHLGRPILREVLTREIDAPSLASVRSPITGYPGDGLTPHRLATILRDADMGDGRRYLELAETIEERDLHYLAVLGTRKRAVAQIDVTVEAASDAADDVRRADMIRAWLKRDELQEELFDILDAVGKGYSVTEIIWDTSEGQWMPARLEWRDPRWYDFDPVDLRTLMRRDETGQLSPLPAMKYVAPVLKAKSGIPLRSGLARVAVWAWMFKAYTQRDWAIFTQTYGQPVRIGKYQSGTSEEDKATLFRAVANIAGDCAAIVPDSMLIEFVESKNVGQGGELYEKRSNWLDQQVSKAVLGQTSTTDAIAGGHAVSKEHRKVQEDIERADARALAAVLNRDLVRPWIDLEDGPQKAYPRIVIARPEQEDLDRLSTALSRLVPLGLAVSASEVRDKFGLSEPDPGEEILGAAQTGGETAAAAAAVPARGPGPQPQAAQPVIPKPDVPEILADTLERAALPAMHEIMQRIEAMLAAASDLDEFRTMLRMAFPEIDTSRLAETMAAGFLAADAGGRWLVENGQ